MGEITDKRLVELDTQIQSATVEPLQEAGYFRVTVPNSLREVTEIKADDEQHAIQRTHEYLKTKIADMPELNAQGNEWTPADDTVVNPEKIG